MKRSCQERKKHYVAPSCLQRTWWFNDMPLQSSCFSCSFCFIYCMKGRALANHVRWIAQSCIRSGFATVPVFGRELREEKQTLGTRKHWNEYANWFKILACLLYIYSLMSIHLPFRFVVLLIKLVINMCMDAPSLKENRLVTWSDSDNYGKTFQQLTLIIIIAFWAWNFCMFWTCPLSRLKLSSTDW